MKILATTAELKAEQEKIVKHQAYDLSLFIGQSYFNNDGWQNCRVFQPFQKTIISFSYIPNTISEWKSKGLSNKNFSPPHTANNHLSPKLIWNNSRIKLLFEGSCLKQ